jgi:hypothetical protein
MRLHLVIGVLVGLGGIAAAQDTNFSTGPQYLMSYGSPLLLHSIATPSLDLNAPPVNAFPQASTEEQPVPPPAVPQSGADLTRIYWGEPAGAVSASENVSEIEISSPQTAPILPAGFLDVGVTEITNAQSLAERGYGMTLAEVAAYSKAHRAHAAHVYTNEDVARLHGG